MKNLTTETRRHRENPYFWVFAALSAANTQRIDLLRDLDASSPPWGAVPLWLIFKARDT
jgi:hypothetical protein